MLHFIAAELKQLNIDFVELTGQTANRTAPIERFQKSDVPVFLISLKAGGTGLNLTAADVVIHYDPWWNPAVEDQATDRAHRIGQEKNVFVYKLIAHGTIEENMLLLQARKKAVAHSIYDEGGTLSRSLTEEDLRLLLKPLAWAKN
jgi:SNF2 family DNA or RNA helicase